MTVRDALKLIDSLLEQAQMNRKQHFAVIEAIDTVKNAVKKQQPTTPPTGGEDIKKEEDVSEV